MPNRWDDRANNGDLDPPVFWHLKRLGRRPPPLAKTLCCQARDWWWCWEHSGGWAEGPQQQKTWRDLSGGLAGTERQLRSSSACQAGCQQQRRWRPSGGLVGNGRGDGTPLEALEVAGNEEDGSPLEDRVTRQGRIPAAEVELIWSSRRPVITKQVGSLWWL